MKRLLYRSSSFITQMSQIVTWKVVINIFARDYMPINGYQYASTFEDVYI